MKLYIAGKVTGDENYRGKFLDAENALYDVGHYPVNPAACVPRGTDWQTAMRRVLVRLLSCDGVALLPGWRKSRGAKIEARLAKDLGLPVKAIGDWLKGKGEISARNPRFE